MKRAMRRILAAVASGLPVALVAHALTFGSGHAVGGALHGLLLDVACAILASGAAFAAAQACAFSRTTSLGSIIATRLGAMLPSTPALLLSGAGWLWSIERLESPHALTPLLLVAALILSTLVAQCTARFGLRALAAVAVSFAHACGIGDRFALARVVRAQILLHLGRLDCVRILSRPPPTFS